MVEKKEKEKSSSCWTALNELVLYDGYKDISDKV